MDDADSLPALAHRLERLERGIRRWRVLGGIAWGASVAGVPTLYIGIGALILLGIGIFSAVGRTRSKDPS